MRTPTRLRAKRKERFALWLSGECKQAQTEASDFAAAARKLLHSRSSRVTMQSMAKLMEVLAAYDAKRVAEPSGLDFTCLA